MNCQSFETTVNELARGALMDAASRVEAHAHAESCPRCAARLADERALTAGLRALAAEAQHGEAPARVEAVLLAAFRVRAAETKGATNATPLRAPEIAPPHVAGSWWLPRWAQGVGVAAATMLLVLGLYNFFLKRPANDATDRAVASATSAQSNQARDHIASSQNSTSGASPVSIVSDENDGVEEVMPVVSHPRMSKRSFGGARPDEARYASGERKNNPFVNEAQAETAEITTEFIPLVQGGFAPGDSGHVIRVELPRTALANFGLPVNVERAGGRVKADVLMGDDGIARAIRFVR